MLTILLHKYFIHVLYCVLETNIKRLDDLKFANYFLRLKCFQDKYNYFRY